MPSGFEKTFISIIVDAVDEEICNFKRVVISFASNVARRSGGVALSRRPSVADCWPGHHPLPQYKNIPRMIINTTIKKTKEALLEG